MSTTPDITDASAFLHGDHTGNSEPFAVPVDAVETVVEELPTEDAPIETVEEVVADEAGELDPAQEDAETVADEEADAGKTEPVTGDEIDGEPETEETAPAETETIAAPTEAELAKLHRPELDEIAKAAGLDGDHYTNKAELAKAIVAAREKE